MTDPRAKEHRKTPHSVALMVMAASVLPGCTTPVGDTTGTPHERDPSQTGLDPMTEATSADDGGLPEANEPLDDADSGAPAAANTAPATTSSTNGNAPNTTPAATSSNGSAPANDPSTSGPAPNAAPADDRSTNDPATNEASAQPAGFLSIDARLHAVLDDLHTISNPVDRERARYFDLSSLSNAGYSGPQLEVHREALSFLLNSLSHGRSVIAPHAVDADKLIYRIDLRDYLWDATSWTQLEAIYPYAVVYDRDSRLFPFDEATAQQIRAETKTQIPLIQSDWFLSHASRPPLYISLLKLPGALTSLEQQLGVDLQRDIDAEQVLRAGFAEAGPSHNNGVIERHELGGNRGALWLSYDFKNNLDFRNVFAHPRDFREDAREVIFNLENGLQAYFVSDAAGQRLDKAPNNVVQDPASRDGAVETGLSCMNCHQTDGQLPKYDEIREVELKASANAVETDKVLALYVTRDELEAAFVNDQTRYRTARAGLGISNISNTSLHELDATHLGIIGLDGVAGLVGLKAEDLKRAIDASRQALPPQIVALLNKDGGIQRDAFDAVVGDFIKAIGLGEQLLVASTGARRSNADTGTNTNGTHY